MSRCFALLSALAVAAVLAAHAVAGPTLDLPKSATKIFNLKPGASYQASLFVPHVRIVIPARGWQGSQHVSNGYAWFFLGWRDRGGIAVISAPTATQSVAATVQKLETERAEGTKVGISVDPALAVRIGGFSGQQFDGKVIGQYGHTFSPFSKSNGGASGSAGDHWRLPDNTAFRIIVLNVRGKAIVFIVDSGHTPDFDPAFSAAETQLLKGLRFPTT